ncbi:MAG: type II toxin-antitoxin system RelE/ParE family toxin [Planctomycetes bacterium]|nr:type II toxin-antitoxin system RelE/ParE family toxin [Planctomycetota bacterium]
MAKYKIKVKTSAAKEIKAIDSKKDRIAIIRKIESLSENPRLDGAIKLSNKEKYRVRQGQFRILYQIFDDIVEVNVVKVAHRKHVYREKR